MFISTFEVAFVTPLPADGTVAEDNEIKDGGQHQKGDFSVFFDLFQLPLLIEL